MSMYGRQKRVSVLEEIRDEAVGMLIVDEAFDVLNDAYICHNYM